MDRTPAAARRRALAVGAALVAVAAGAPVRGAVVLQATSAQVSSPGGTGRICVMLSSDNEPVAGIMADLRWDGNCATLPSKDRCVPAGSHGKDVHADIDKQQADFSARVLVLSLSNVEVIPDGPVFCCDFQGEAEPGSCCDVFVASASASTPEGDPIAINSGARTTICTSRSGNQPGRGGMGSPSGEGPLSASNAPPPSDAGGAAAPAPAPAAQPAARAPAQVLPGGGTRVENPADVGVIPPTVPALQLPTTAAAVIPTAAPTAAGTPRAALAPATAAATSPPTQAPTAPAPADTPTRRVPAAPPTKAPAVPKQEAVPPAAKAADDGGWFGCQMRPGASAGPLVGLGLLALLGAIVRRRRK